MPTDDNTQRFFVIGVAETNSFLLYYQSGKDTAPCALRAFDDGDDALICLKLLMAHGRDLRPAEILPSGDIDLPH